MPDGVCAIEVEGEHARLLSIGLTRGDPELISWVRQHVGEGDAFLAIDAPIVCINPTGARPVDRQSHVEFGRYHAGSHPANTGKCPRPRRIARSFASLGFRVGWDQGDGTAPGRLMSEVYPHPAIVRLFGLEERIPYKKGAVTERRREFRRYQRLLRKSLDDLFPRLELNKAAAGLLTLGWTKDVEDQTDGLLCALIAYWHWMHRGAQSQVLGDLATGFILVPRPEPPITSQSQSPRRRSR